MTDTNEQITTEQVEEEVTDEETYTPPFLRITSTYTGADDRVETLYVELNLRDDEAVGEYNPSSPADSTAARSWVLDLVATTIREMHRAAQAVTYHLDFRDTTIDPERLRQIVREAETAGHTGSDRWTGGDRKDAN